MLVYSTRIAILSVFMLYSSHASKPSGQAAQKPMPVQSNTIAQVVQPQFFDVPLGKAANPSDTPTNPPPGAIKKPAQENKAPSQWSGCKGSCTVQ